MAVASYLLLTIVLWGGLTDQVSNRTFDMTWRATGSANQAGQAEVRLEFSGYPGHFVDVYGSALRDHLIRRGADRIPVEFQVVSDLWCMRGFHEVRIDHQEPGQIYWTAGASGSFSPTVMFDHRGEIPVEINRPSGPWETPHWWCR